MEGNRADDRFITVLLPPMTRHQTPVVKKSLNPSYPADGATFDHPIYLSLAGVVGARGLEAVVWDKVSSRPLHVSMGQADGQDLLRKEYMGETTIPFTSWFPSGEAQLWTDNLPVSLLHTTPRKWANDSS
jgi:phosphatidylserine decarboxylase